MDPRSGRSGAADRTFRVWAVLAAGMVAYAAYLFWAKFGWSGVWDVAWRAGAKLALTAAVGLPFVAIWLVVRLIRGRRRPAG